MEEQIVIPTLTLDFASPANTIQNFATCDDALTAPLAGLSTELALAELRLDQRKAAVELEVRNSGIKVTEGYVTATVDANTEIVALRNGVEILRGKVAGIKAGLASLERKHSLFKAWLASQRPIGLTE